MFGCRGKGFEISQKKLGLAVVSRRAIGGQLVVFVSFVRLESYTWGEIEQKQSNHRLGLIQRSRTCSAKPEIIVAI